MEHNGPLTAPFRVSGGFPVGVDNRVRTIFTHNPSSLRLSSTHPNLQNLPRGNDSQIQRWVKDMFVAPAGSIFWAVDFAAIEARLVGYFAGAPRVIRLADLGIHAYLASHILKQPADLAWSDADLRLYFKKLKGANKATYDDAKRVVYLSLYMGTPRKMHYEYPDTFPTVKAAAYLQDMFFELLPEVPQWHKDLCQSVDATRRRKLDDGEAPGPWTLGVAYAQNPFGYIHRFYNVLDWERRPCDQDAQGEIKYEWASTFGDDAKRLVSNLPQSTAAAIIKRTARRLWYDYPEVGRTLRLLIHDEVFGESEEAWAEQCVETAMKVMTEPIQELPLDPAWGMGQYMCLKAEAKMGRVWSQME